jgi:hypothetical protein
MHRYKSQKFKSALSWLPFKILILKIFHVCFSHRKAASLELSWEQKVLGIYKGLVGCAKQ